MRTRIRSSLGSFWPSNTIAHVARFDGQIGASAHPSVARPVQECQFRKVSLLATAGKNQASAKHGNSVIISFRSLPASRLFFSGARERQKQHHPKKTKERTTREDRPTTRDTTTTHHTQTTHTTPFILTWILLVSMFIFLEIFFGCFAFLVFVLLIFFWNGMFFFNCSIFLILFVKVKHLAPKSGPTHWNT